jgi:hypothetical protein
MRETFNLRVGIGLLLFITLIVWEWPEISLRSTTAWQQRIFPFLSVVVFTFSVLLSPLLVLAVRLWQSGDYVR